MRKEEYSLADRMHSYEKATESSLICGIPKIIRLDMRSGRTFTKTLEKPFDAVFTESMKRTAIELCKNISGACFAFVASDEISVVVRDRNEQNGEVVDIDFYNNRIQKTASVSASIATVAFNKAWIDILKENNISDNRYTSRIMCATFDSRFFSLPDTTEVHNYLVWRQRDTIRNAVNGIAHVYFRQKETNGKNRDELIVMLKNKGVSFESFPRANCYGSLAVREETKIDGNVIRNKWVTKNCMIFTEDARTEAITTAEFLYKYKQADMIAVRFPD